MPETLGHVRTNEAEIYMADLGMGDKHARALASSLEVKANKVEVLNMRNNRLTGKGAAELLLRLNPLIIRDIDLSNNCLGVVAMEGMFNLLKATASLRNLSMEACNISPSALRILISGV